MRIDVDVPLAGDLGTMGLELDFTKRHGANRPALKVAEETKETKYGKVYRAPMTVRGVAFNEFAELGPHGQDAVDRAVALGEQNTGSHPDDLRRELLAAIAHAIHFGNASALAYFKEVNNDHAGLAPLPQGLVRRGQELATGVTGQLTGPGTRGRGRPKKVSVPVRRAPPMRGAAGTARCEDMEVSERAGQLVGAECVTSVVQPQRLEGVCGPSAASECVVESEARVAGGGAPAVGVCARA
jgi:hypothetical protein